MNSLVHWFVHSFFVPIVCLYLSVHSIIQPFNHLIFYSFILSFFLSFFPFWYSLTCCIFCLVISFVCFCCLYHFISIFLFFFSNIYFRSISSFLSSPSARCGSLDFLQNTAPGTHRHRCRYALECWIKCRIGLPDRR